MQPLFDDRPFAVQLIGGIVIPVVFGLVTGFALAWNEVVYYILAVPIGLGGAFLAGTEHVGADEGFARGCIGGLLFGSFVLLGLEIVNDEPEAYLGDPRAGLVVVTVVVGGIAGACGGAWRQRREAAGAAPAPR
jgi:hypothetical protein